MGGDPVSRDEVKTGVRNIKNTKTTSKVEAERREDEK